MRLPIGFIKIEVSIPEARKALETFAEGRKRALDKLSSDLRTSVSDALNQLLSAEMALFLGRPDQVDNKRNGYDVKDYTLKGVGTVRVRVPVDRKRRFESAVIPKKERFDPRLKEDMAALHLAGISTRTLAMMSKRILGVEVSHQTVSQSLPLLAEHAQKWLHRPITGEWWALIVDGTNFKVTRRGSTQKEPSLVILGIDSSNRRSVLAIEPGTRDSADAWRAAFRELKRRGVDAAGVKVGVMDGLPGLETVFREEFPNSVTARCWFHAMTNALKKTPKRLHDAFHVLAKRIMYAESQDAAREAFAALEQSMGGDCARAVQCLRKDLDSLVSHYQFPKAMWQGLKTTNAVERIHKEFKRRSRSMEGMGEVTLETLLAFTAMRLEMSWRRRAIDTYVVDHFRKGQNKLPSLEAFEADESMAIH